MEAQQQRDELNAEIEACKLRLADARRVVAEASSKVLAAQQELVLAKKALGNVNNELAVKQSALRALENNTAVLRAAEQARLKRPRAKLQLLPHQIANS